jgi:hypothetical protein
MPRRNQTDGNDAIRYGIGEWYGHLVASLPSAKLSEFAEIGSGRLSNLPCPFRRAADPAALCKKKGGVCSIRKHVRRAGGAVAFEGPLVTLCPSRFWAGNEIFAEIGEALLGTRVPHLVKEVPFLSSIVATEDTDLSDQESANAVETGEGSGLGKPVGRIDTILVDPSDWKKWCALELQAVYFSGKGMGTHLAQYADAVQIPVFPDKVRRPDFRSSGPKRLMPQLQTKVPTLRRWGKKMAVVIDRPFLSSLGHLQPVRYVSNSDIVWFVVDYDTDTGALKIVDSIPTTLETSVEALTAGIPMSLEDFEADVHRFLVGRLRKERDKVIKLSDPQPSARGGSTVPGGAELPESEAETPSRDPDALSLGGDE